MQRGRGSEELGAGLEVKFLRLRRVELGAHDSSGNLDVSSLFEARDIVAHDVFEKVSGVDFFSDSILPELMVLRVMEGL